MKVDILLKPEAWPIGFGFFGYFIPESMCCHVLDRAIQDAGICPIPLEED
jgi:hypothetical protein